MFDQLGHLLGFTDGMMISAQIEYSFEKLEAVELEPVTAYDFDMIEQNSAFIEQNLLNQMQLFYPDQQFILHLPNYQVARLQTKIKKSRKTNLVKCFYLTKDCELHIIPKTHEQEEKEDEIEDDGAEEQNNGIENDELEGSDDKEQQQSQEICMKL